MADERIAVLWARGEAPWRDLRNEIAAAGRVAAVSEHSMHLLDVELGVAIRLPGAWANRVPGDTTRRPLLSVEVATPCGLVLGTGESDAWMSTPLVLLLAGWPAPAVVAAPVASLHRRHGFRSHTSVDHPGGPCGALYCAAQQGGS